MIPGIILHPTMQDHFTPHRMSHIYLFFFRLNLRKNVMILQYIESLQNALITNECNFTTTSQ
jgi:hypothetical protein